MSGTALAAGTPSNQPMELPSIRKGSTPPIIKWQTGAYANWGQATYCPAISTALSAKNAGKSTLIIWEGAVSLGKPIASGIRMTDQTGVLELVTWRNSSPTPADA